jgi:hypothetical protein
MAHNDEDMMDGVEQDDNSVQSSDSDQDTENNENLKSTGKLQSDEKLDSDKKLLEANPHKQQIEEHAKIIRRQCREQKRGDWKQKRTITEVGVEMGWLEGSEEDRHERKILEEARARNKLGPRPTGRWHTEATHTSNENPHDRPIDDAWADKVYHHFIDDFYKSLIKPFKKWVIHAINEGIWIKPAQLPLAFKFAMRRPHMPEVTFQSTLRSMGLHNGFELGHAPTSNTKRSHDLDDTPRKLKDEIDLEPSMEHPHGTLESSPSEAGSPTRIQEDVAEKGFSSTIDVDDTTREDETYQRIFALYRKIQGGQIDLQEAPSRYRNALDLHGVDNEVLIDALRELRIPFHQIPRSGRLVSRGPQKGDTFNVPISGGGDLRRHHMLNDDDPSPTHKEVAQIIDLYRSGTLKLYATIRMIQEALSPIISYFEDIEDKIDSARNSAEAALAIWEEACENPEDEEYVIERYDLESEEGDDVEDQSREQNVAKARPSEGRTRVEPKQDPATPEPSSTRKSRAVDSIQTAGFDDGDAKDTIDTIELLIMLYRSEDIAFKEARDKIQGSLQRFHCDRELITDTMQSPGMNPREAADLIWTVAFTNGPSHEAESLHQQPKAVNEGSSKGNSPNKSESQDFGSAGAQSESQNTSNGKSVKRKASQSPRSISSNQRSPIPWGTPPTVLPKASQPGNDSKIKDLPASAPGLGLNFSAAVGPEKRYERSGTPIPNPTSQAAIGDPKIFVKTSWDGSVPIRERAPSPEDGLTDDLYGLIMSTKKARELGHAMGLPADYLMAEVRTHPIGREQKKETIATDLVCLNSSKRKASITMRSPSPAKSPKLGHFEFFAIPGETPVEFVESHLGGDGTTQPRHLCPRCLQWPCYCWHNFSEDWCPKCEQAPCGRMLDIQSPESDQTGQQDMIPSPEPAKRVLGGRTRLFKTPNMVVAFLSSRTRDENIYDKIIGLEKLPLKLGTIRSVHVMLKDIERAVSLGKIKGPRGAKDKEIITVLRRVRGSLKSLQENGESHARIQAPALNLANPVSAGETRSMQSQHPGSVVAHIRCFTNDATIFTQLRQWGRSPVTDTVYQTVRTMYNHIEDGIQSKHVQVQGYNDTVAMSIMQRIIIDYEGKENSSSNSFVEKSIPPEDANRTPLLTYLSRVMDFGDPFSILEDIARSPMSDSNIRNLIVITDHIEKGIKSGELDKSPAKGGKDAEVQAIIESLQIAATPLQARTNSSNALKTPKKDALGPSSAYLKSDYDQSSRLSSQPAGPRTQPGSICSPYEDPEHSRKARSAFLSAVATTDKDVESKEQPSRASPEMSKIKQAVPPTTDSKESHADCIACSKKLHSDGLVSLSCKHSMCRPCIEVLTRECLENADRFPPSHCNTAIALRVMVRNVPPELFARFRKRQLEVDLAENPPSGRIPYRAFPGICPLEIRPTPAAGVPTSFKSLPTPAHSRSGSQQVAQAKQTSGNSDGRKCDADKDTMVSPLPRHGNSSLRTQSRVEASNTPPASPKSEPSELPLPPTPKPKPTELPKSMDAAAQSPVPGLRKPRDRSPPPPGRDEASKEGSNMAAEDALEHYKDLALRRQVPFTSILSEQRAIRAQADRKNQEVKANLTWESLRFFSSPNASTTVTSSAAVSKMFDKYRGMVVL